ncbi:MAG: hypothetical protein A3F12_00805 [Gammaproteobacteria bacterium RIFCSPHIGHO2_12_FULL_38_14]|nr:MAG: hypothetical protein A3F12_00805 [Gammaproteobacteria bacterium RIFCSPHIGHO2_12_FULL_38_14]
MPTRIEAEIMRPWRLNEKPVVSIICITYNHQSYIKDALESFLAQETDFPFEIIVHDDASTDSTSTLVKQYAEKYPHIVKPIFQKENRSSQLKKNVLLPIILTAISYAQGQYIAYCDGDDYWIDKDKLKIQISEMQKFPNCEMSFHPVMRKSTNGRKRKKIIAKHSANNKIFETKQLILGSARFCPTVSFIFKKCVFESIPNWLFDAPCTDYFMQVLTSLKGGALYINRAMAVYRERSIGSWSEKVTIDENLVYDYYIGMLQALDDINAQTENKFKKEFNIIKKKLCFFMSANPALSSSTRKKIFKNHRNIFSIKRKIIWYLIFRNKKLLKLTSNAYDYMFR